MTGHSAGWCSEAINAKLDAREIMCSALDGKVCRFIVAESAKIFALLKNERFYKNSNEYKYLTVEL